MKNGKMNLGVSLYMHTINTRRRPREKQNKIDRSGDVDRRCDCDCERNHTRGMEVVGDNDVINVRTTRHFRTMQKLRLQPSRSDARKTEGAVIST